MLLPTLKLIAPSLWFLSSIGLAQLGASPDADRMAAPSTETARPAVTQKYTHERRAVKSASKRTTKRKSLKLAQLAKKPNKKVTKRSKGSTPSKGEVKAPTCDTVEDMKSNVECVIEKIQRKYRTMQSMTATFKQTYTYAVYQRTQVSSGKVFLKSPGRMRWDYKSPTPKVFVADGKTLWVYEPTKNQAYQRPLTDSQLPVAIRFLMGQGDLLAEFLPAFESANDQQIVVRLTPKKPTTEYKSLSLVINRSDYMVRETTIKDSVNNTNRVQFSNPVLKLDLPDVGFQFVPPEGVTILR